MAIIGYPAGIGGTFWRAVCPPAAGRSTAVAGRCRGGHLGAPRMLGTQLKDRITPHVTNFFRLRLTIEEQEGKRKYKSDGAVMVGEFVCMYVCSCTVSE